MSNRFEADCPAAPAARPQLTGVTEARPYPWSRPLQARSSWTDKPEHRQVDKQQSRLPCRRRGVHPATRWNSDPLGALREPRGGATLGASTPWNPALQALERGRQSQENEPDRHEPEGEA